jgi:hypothetical protein
MREEFRHLFNALLIDLIIEDGINRHDIWEVFCDEGESWYDWYLNECDTKDGAMDKALERVWDTVDNTDKEELLDNALDKAWGVRKLHAILALTAWDDSCNYLTMPSEQVHMLAILGDPKAFLMLPAVWVFEQPRKEE